MLRLVYLDAALGFYDNVFTTMKKTNSMTAEIFRKNQSAYCFAGLNQSFDTANQRFSGRAGIFQRFH